ncbi:MAG: hypothetical protein AAFV85_28250, partial [Cyanobacteria bacterium J06634_6]
PSLMGRWDWGQKGTQSANIFLEPKLHFGCLNGWHPKCKTGATRQRTKWAIAPLTVNSLAEPQAPPFR